MLKILLVNSTKIYGNSETTMLSSSPLNHFGRRVKTDKTNLQKFFGGKDILHGGGKIGHGRYWDWGANLF